MRNSQWLRMVSDIKYIYWQSNCEPSKHHGIGNWFMILKYLCNYPEWNLLDDWLSPVERM